MSRTLEAAPQRYCGIVFKRGPDTADFSTSGQEVLPGRHTREGAWQAVHAVLRGPRGHAYVGGEVRPG